MLLQLFMMMRYNGSFSSYFEREWSFSSIYIEKKKQELSEYKAIYMIKDYFPLFFQAMVYGSQCRGTSENSASPVSSAALKE